MKRMFLCMLALAALIHADESRLVDVTGVGDTREHALQNGLRTAVEKAVGMFLTSQTLVENNALIQDRILSYSSGYVEDYQVKSASNAAGQVELLLSVRVASLRIRQTLDSLHIAVAPLPGQAFSVQIETKQKADHDAAKFLGPVISKYPKAAYSIIVKTPKLLQSNADVANLEVSYTVTADGKWFQEFEQSVAAIATRQKSAPNLQDIFNTRKSNGNSIVFGRSQKLFAQGGCAMNELQMGTLMSSYRVLGKAYDQAFQRLIQPMTLKMVFYSSAHEVVYTSTISFDPIGKCGINEWGLSRSSSVLGAFGDEGTNALFLYKDYHEGYKAIIHIPVGVLKNIASVECFFDAPDMPTSDDDESGDAGTP